MSLDWPTKLSMVNMSMSIPIDRTLQQYVRLEWMPLVCFSISECDDV